MISVGPRGVVRVQPPSGARAAWSPGGGVKTRCVKGIAEEESQRDTGTINEIPLTAGRSSVRERGPRGFLMTPIRQCETNEQATILAIINAAARLYHGAIPADCWHEPYMSAEQLAREISAGVSFWGYEENDGKLAGAIGVQRVRDVTLIRHAYVRPDRQGRGIGGDLLRHLETLTDERVLVGTWADAVWEIRFYENHGYALVPKQETPTLLRTYWDIPPRQVETSVVLAKDARASR